MNRFHYAFLPSCFDFLPFLLKMQAPGLSYGHSRRPFLQAPFQEPSHGTFLQVLLTEPLTENPAGAGSSDY